MSEPNDPSVHPSRREVLQEAAAAGLSSLLAPLAFAGEAPRRDLIRAENERAGTTEWMLANTRVDPKTKYRCPWIEGYCSHASLRAGETLSFLVSTNPPSPFVLDRLQTRPTANQSGVHRRRDGR
jgi:hypothetical protein